MSTRSWRRPGSTWRRALRALLDALVDTDPGLPRSRSVRRAAWVGVLVAPLVLLLSFEVGRAEVPESGGLLAVVSVASAAAVALLGHRPLIAWRVAAATCFGWLTLFGQGALVGDFMWPRVQSAVLLLSLLVVLLRYRRAVTWGAWAWTALLMVLGGYGDRALGWFVGLTIVAILIDSARQRATAQDEAQRERGARAEQEVHSLVLEERARIARDLHDVVAHHMSMVAVQAETAQFRIADLDQPARDEFASIAGSARSALTDVRGILSVLRDGADAAERAPQPTLADLEPLVESARSAGAEVRLAVVGERRPLRAAVELGVYRVVQESLANAARHAPGAVVVVALSYGEHELDVTVTNARPRRPAATEPVADGARPAAGHGLVGMRERAALLGGRLTAGPTADGGFRVAATVPTEMGEQ